MGDLFEPDVLDSLLRQWSRGLRARNRSARTIATYADTAGQLAAFAREHDQVDFDRALIEDYLADLADRWKPRTVAFRYRSLFRHLVPARFTNYTWACARSGRPS